MPEFSERETSETVLRDVQPFAHEHREESAREAEYKEHRCVLDSGVAVLWHREQWPSAEDQRMHAGTKARRDHERNECPRRELEQQELDREDDRRQWCAEDRSHPRCRAAREEDFALRRCHADELADQRTERAPRNDDRSFRSEGSTGADRDRRRDRFGDGGTRGDPALPREHGLHRLGDPVTPDHRRPLREQGDHEPTGDRGEHERAVRVEVAQ